MTWSCILNWCLLAMPMEQTSSQSHGRGAAIKRLDHRLVPKSLRWWDHSFHLKDHRQGEESECQAALEWGDHPCSSKGCKIWQSERKIKCPRSLNRDCGHARGRTITAHANLVPEASLSLRIPIRRMTSGIRIQNTHNGIVARILYGGRRSAVMRSRERSNSVSDWLRRMTLSRL